MEHRQRDLIAEDKVANKNLNKNPFDRKACVQNEGVPEYRLDKDDPDKEFVNHSESPDRKDSDNYMDATEKGDIQVSDMNAADEDKEEYGANTAKDGNKRATIIDIEDHADRKQEITKHVSKNPDKDNASMKDLSGERSHPVHSREPLQWLQCLFPKCLWPIKSIFALLLRLIRKLCSEKKSTSDDDCTKSDAFFCCGKKKLYPSPDKKRDFSDKNGLHGGVCADKVVVRGLGNLGNTCFMNSTIQCLYYTSPLTKYFITDSYLRDIHSGLTGELVDKFAHLVKALDSGEHPSFFPRDFKKVMDRYKPKYAKNEQQDSREFLMFLVEGLHDGLKKVKDKPVIPDENVERPTNKRKAAEISSRSDEHSNESIFDELFQGHFEQTTMCLSCREKTVNLEEFKYLYIPITQSTLNGCLKDYFAEQPIKDDSMCHKKNCRDNSKCVIKKKILKPPKILIIVLLRFEGNTPKKIHVNVDFKTSGMNISKFMTDSRQQTYELYGVSNHQGESSSGHYTACCKNPDNQKWYEFNDTIVKMTSISKIKTPDAYVLYYKSTYQTKYDRRKAKKTTRKEVCVCACFCVCLCACGVLSFLCVV